MAKPAHSENKTETKIIIHGEEWLPASHIKSNNKNYTNCIDDIMELFNSNNNMYRQALKNILG